MKKNEFYLNSLELVCKLLENKLHENENSKIENEINSIFCWILSQFYYEINNIFPVKSNYCITLRGTVCYEVFSLQYEHGFEYSSEYYSDYVTSYKDFRTALKEVLKIFKQNESFKIKSCNIPECEEQTSDIEITLALFIIN